MQSKLDRVNPFTPTPAATAEDPAPSLSPQLLIAFVGALVTQAVTYKWIDAGTSQTLISIAGIVIPAAFALASALHVGLVHAAQVSASSAVPSADVVALQTHADKLTVELGTLKAAVAKKDTTTHAKVAEEVDKQLGQKFAVLAGALSAPDLAPDKPATT